jgi:hypothetical protein
MVILIPKTYKIIKKSHNSAVARSPDEQLSLFFAKQPHNQTEAAQAEFIDRVIADLTEQVTDLRRLELEPAYEEVNGIPMLQVAIAGKTDQGEVKVGLFMLEMAEHILFVMAIIHKEGANLKQSELSKIFASIRDRQK